MLLQSYRLELNFPTGGVDTRALPGIDLDLSEGSFTAILGPSESGSTTLLDCLSWIVTRTVGEVRIAAVIDTELHEGVSTPWNASSQLGVTPQNTQLFLKSTTTTGQVLAALPPQVRFSERTTFINHQIESRRANIGRSNIALFSTIYAMTVSLLQSAITSGTSHRKELELYRSLGLRTRSIVTVQSIILPIVSALLLTVAIAAMYWQFIGGPAGMTSFIPWELIGTAVATAAVLMVLATVGGTIYLLKVIAHGSATELSS